MLALELIHFFSPETKVSLELPVGWEEAETDTRVAIYTYDLEEDDPTDEPGLNPKYIVRMLGLPKAQAQAHHRLAKQMLAHPRQALKILSHGELQVDNQPAVVDVFSYADPDTDTRLLHYQVFIQIDRVVCSLTGMAEETQSARWLPDFEMATQSVRFIPV